MRQLLVIVSVLVAGLAHAATFSKPEVTLELPDGWVEVPAAVMQQFHDDLQRQAPLAQAPRYDYAFQSSNGPPWLHYPYVLVKISPSGRPAERDLETLPTIDLDSKVRDKTDAWANVLKDSALGQMRYDKAANVVWLSSTSDIANIGRVTGLSGMLPTEKGFVELHAYAPAADFPQLLPTFQQIIGGAKIAPELRYAARGDGGLTGPSGKLLGVALAVGAAIAIFIAIRRRRKS